MATSKDGVHWDELGSVLEKEDRVTWMGTGPTARLRLLLQNPYLERYLDEVLVECFSLPAPATGCICLPGGGAGHLEAWRFG